MTEISSCFCPELSVSVACPCHPHLHPHAAFMLAWEAELGDSRRKEGLGKSEGSPGLSLSCLDPKCQVRVEHLLPRPWFPNPEDEEG